MMLVENTVCNHTQQDYLRRFRELTKINAQNESQKAEELVTLFKNFNILAVVVI